MIINKIKFAKGYYALLALLVMACSVKGYGQMTMNISDSLFKKLHVKTEIVTFRGDKTVYRFNYDREGKLKEWIFGKLEDKSDCSTVVTYTYDLKGNLITDTSKNCNNPTALARWSPNIPFKEYSLVENYEYDNQARIKRCYTLNDLGKLVKDKIYDNDSLKVVEIEYNQNPHLKSSIERTTYYESKDVPRKEITKYFSSMIYNGIADIENFKNIYNRKHQLVKQEIEATDRNGKITNIISTLEYYRNGLLKYIVYGDNTDRTVLSGPVADKFFDYEYYK